MKKTIILLIFLQIFYVSHSQDVKARIMYQATLNSEDYKNRMMKDTTLTESRKQKAIANIAMASPINLTLLINGNEALYQVESDIKTEMGTESKYNRPGLLQRSLNRTSLMARDFNTYYTNTITNEKFYQCQFTPDVLVNIEVIDWALTQETKEIGKYTCFKAIATIDSEQIPNYNLMRPVEAWYTPEIPISFGIQSFSGLPGLTLELTTDYEDGKVFYTATKIELNPEEEINIERPEAEQQMTEQEYAELIKKLNDRRKSKG